MNEIAMSDKNLTMERTPKLIAVEINSIKEQVRKMVLFNSIEIGRRLAEAKTLLDHGEWGDWLEKYVDYSQRTASNLMGIFTQYGTDQITFFCDNAKSQALANLSYTQAVALMGIPQDERESFAENNDIDSMSTRELKQAVKENKELAARLKEVEVSWEKDKKIAVNAKNIAIEKADEARKLLDEKQSVESNLRTTDHCLREAQADVKMLQTNYAKKEAESKKEIERLGLSISEARASGNADEVERLQESIKKADRERVNLLNKIEDLELQLKETPIEVTAAPVIEKVPEEVQRELDELRAKVAQPVDTAKLRFKLHFDSLVKGFSDLLGTLEEIKEVDVYKKAVAGLLSKMSDRL